MKGIQYNDIQPKPWTRNGVTRQSKNTQGTYNAAILPGRYIHIFGVMTNHVDGPQHFDRTFKVGDAVEHGSYNLRYTGKITAIGKQTVTIERSDIGSNATRMHLYEFIDRNWDFDAVKIAKDNAIEMQCL